MVSQECNFTVTPLSLREAIYASEEIEARIAFDSKSRYWSAGARPTWQDLRRFRRQKRHFIHEALSRTLQAAWEFRLWTGTKMLPMESDGFDLLVAIDYADSERASRFAMTADDRINQAVLWDSMALDD